MQLTIDIQKRQVVSGTDDTGLVFPGNKLVFTYGEVLSVSVSLVKGAQAATPAEGQEFVLALGDDWSLETTPLAVADAVAGQDGSLVFELSLRTETMLDYVDGSRLLPAWLWCYRKEGDGIVPLCSQLVRAHGSVYDDGTPPEDEVRTTYTRAEVDALIDSIPSTSVDDELSDSSEHPVQNKVITLAMQGKQAAPATPGQPGQFLALDVNGAPAFVPPPTVSVDSQMSTTSENPVQNKVITSALVYTALATSTAASLTITPGTATTWTPAGNGTLSVSGGEAGKRAYAMLDIVLGASNAVTLSGLSWMSETDALVSSATNRCVVVFDGVTATIGVC